MRRLYLLSFMLAVLAAAGLQMAAQPLHARTQHSDGVQTGVASYSNLITPRPQTPFQTIPMTRSPYAFSGAGKAPQGAADAPTIYGSMIFSMEWNLTVANPGMYSFPATPDLKFTLEHEGYLTDANGGGTYADSRYYMYYWFESSGAVFTYFRVFDTDTWEALFSERTVESYVGTDLTYDRTTETIYGCYFSFQTNQYYFGTTNPSNGAVTILGSYSEPLFALAADVDGNLYAVTSNGYLNHVDKTNGKLSPIGRTGLIPAYTQSMAFDYKTNKLYWSAVTSSTSGLYEVDTTTGAATNIAYYDYNEEFAGIYIANVGASASAPGELSAFHADYVADTDTDIKVDFTLPTTTFSGATLSGTLDWVIRVNNVDIDMGSGAPGSHVSYTVKGTPAGYAVITAYASNDAGAGPESRERKWIGRDNPRGVSDLTATIDGNTIKLTWGAPTEGVHGGYLDTSTLSYKVTRNPGNVPVCQGTRETTFTDVIDTTVLSAYTYDVTAYAGNLSGETVSTQKMLMGEAFTPPYKETFSSYSDFTLFTVVDANNDGKTWTWDDGAVRGDYSFLNDMDDWLISPPVRLSHTDLYSVCVAARTFGYTEKLEICMGTSPDPAAMTAVVVPCQSLYTSSYTDVKGDFIPETDGIYYIGVHHVSDKERNTLYINRMELTKLTSITAPAQPGDVQVIPGEKGALTATVKFTAPDKDLSGAPVTSLTGAKIYKGNRIVKNFTGITPGEELTYTDNGCSHGINEYRIFASNSDGDGRDITVSAFIGIDVPHCANNIRLIQEDGKAHLMWDAPDRGVNGGYVDPDNIRYHIASQDFTLGGTSVVAMNLTEREFWDTPVITGQQGMAAYYVYALNDEGVGYGYRSNVLIMGTPYALPFAESFAGNTSRYDTWRFENSIGDNTWGIADGGTYPACSPVDGDGGLMSFQPAVEGAVSMIISGLVGIADAEAPVFEFNYYFNRMSSDKITAMVSTNGYDFDALATADMSQISGMSGWKKVSVPLTGYKSNGFVQVAIRVDAGQDLANVHFDNIVVRDQPERDLAVTSLTVPGSFSLGNEARFYVTVTNMGVQTAGTYSVALLRDGNEVAETTGASLVADASQTFEFAQTPDQSFGEKVEYSARVSFDGDSNSSNDMCAPKTVFVILPTYPAVTDLSGSIDATNTARLSWSEPSMTGSNRITESFESYSPFIITGIGDWQTLDRDGDFTVYVSNAGMWPNAGEPQAYIVFNAEKAGLADDYSDGTPSMFLAHEGSQMLISFAADENGNDDWLISPRLSGKEQEISFYIKSLTDYYGVETWEFYTSMGEFRENFSEFVKFAGAGGTANEQWSRVTVTVPEGTNYFAIRCTSNDSFGFCIDDITYTPATVSVELQGYHVFCNDVCLTSAPVTGTTYAHEGVDPKGDYRYNVVCVYDKGESVYSNTLRLGESGLDAVESASVTVSATDGMLHIAGAAGLGYSVHSVEGYTVATGVAAARTDLPLAAGVYVVAVGDRRFKVAVR